MIQLLISLLILLFVNIISYFLFTRIDLTAEKTLYLVGINKKIPERH